ncbi:MAG TPA: sigma-70 family RNA polymerase sigma factor [Solirubrobacteraceae bacterium]|nr:sigma-70 family RNA polymerase sigma factor [Solirubrobacteraceae bacterium]
MAVAPPHLDGEARRWVQRLRAGADGHEEAVRELHALLLKAARFEVGRQHARRPQFSPAERDDLAQQSADDALVAVLAKLDGFRGASRFETWAYKFALLEAGVAVRRHAWRGREVQLDPEAWGEVAARLQGPDDDAQMRELIAAVQHAIGAELSPRQREVLVAITLEDVPIDVLAERLETTRGALYKALHDARAKLRGALALQGFEVGAR